MATVYQLFPDRREEAANVAAAVVEVGDLVPPEPDEALPRLARIDWSHPALLVYRGDGEDRWSQVLLGLTKPEFGEADG